ncbi:hypothetical protein A9Q99_22290 [Gammaproteobacteria bacterium 45_16_T64]|nr:hypothetical protein A9Q99_22290 [Gammaproteobacteria bacterium 45_16_T64]
MINTENMRLLYKESLVINRPIADVFYYLGHTFENADTWLYGCKKIKAYRGHERFGMRLGKKYMRYGGGPFKIGTMVMEEEVILFEENKRFMLKTFSDALQPYWDYHFTKVDENTTRWEYFVYSDNNKWKDRLFQRIFFGIAIKRLVPAHLKARDLLESNSVLVEG